MFKKFFLYGAQDLLALFADYFIAKLHFFISADFKRKNSLFNIFFSKGVEVKKISSDLYDFKYKVNNEEMTFRARFDNSDPEVFDQVILNKEYLPLVELIKNRKTNPLVLIDCGANVGYTTMYLSAFFNFDKIIVVEPNRETFSLLEYNLKDISSQKSVLIENKGVWSKTTKLDVDVSFRDGKAWSFALKENEKDGEIQVVSLQELIDQNGIDQIDVLKIDIEGSEAKLFSDTEGIKRVLSKTRYIAIEIHDEFKCREIIENILKESSFEFFQSSELTIGFNKRK